MNGIIMCVCSCTVVVYVLGLDIAALSRSAAVTRVNIFHWFSGLRGYYASVQLGIPFLMLIEDLLLTALTIAFVCVKFCLCCAKVSNAYVLLGPVSCIIVHSFHILVGFIHAPYHATSILVLYSVAFFVYIFAMRSTYHCLGKCVQSKPCVILWLIVLSVIVFAGFVIIISSSPVCAYQPSY